MKEVNKVVSINFPVSVIDFFEAQAKQELDDECDDYNWIAVSKRRNEFIISALEQAIKMYKEL